MTENLSPTQREIYEDYILDDDFTATAVNIAGQMGYNTASTVYDHISSIRARGFEIGQNDRGEYVPTTSPDNQPLNVSAPNRQDSASKQTITRKANKVMVNMEEDIKRARAKAGPVVADGGEVVRDQHQDVMIPCADDHFGDVDVNEENTEVFNSEILASRIRQKFDYAIEKMNAREEMGQTIDTVYVPLLGDHVTNEAIYEGQPWEVKEHIRDQLAKATETYGQEIERLAKLYPRVVVPCNHGNHGEFRVKGSSHHANADDFLYDRLELWVHASDLDNVTFIRSDRSASLNFTVRGDTWNVHLRHGQNVNSHIGTSSPQNTWKGHLHENDFDMALRGHYHMHKEEPVRGRPVFMVPTLANSSEFEAMLGVSGGHPQGIVLGFQDDALPAWKDYIHF